MGGGGGREHMNLDRKRSGARDVKKILCFGENRKFVGKEDVNGTVKILSMVMVEEREAN